MKILQFAFDSGPANPYLPHHYTPNNVVYGGTHDNETMVGYFSANGKPLAFAAQYLHCEATPAAVAAACLRAGLASVADLAIFTLADHMGLDNRARINTPASGVGNWQWRLSPGMLTDELAIRIREQTKLYER